MGDLQPFDGYLHNIRDVEYLDDPPTEAIQTTGCGKRLLTKTILHSEGVSWAAAGCPVCFEPEVGPAHVETRIIDGRN